MKNIKIGQNVYNEVSEIEVDLADNSGTAIFTDNTSNLPGYQPNADMIEMKKICENDIQEKFSHKILQMINNLYSYTTIKIPENGAVKTSDGNYYTYNENDYSANTIRHVWESSKDITPKYYTDFKLRWIIFYYSSVDLYISDQDLLNESIYICFNNINSGVGNLFNSKRMLEYFDILNGLTFFREGHRPITNFDDMFSRCSSLKSVQSLIQIDTSNVTSYNSMFGSCNSLQSIPLIDTSNGISFNNMFDGCKSLNTIPRLNTSKGERFERMFSECDSLQTIPMIDISKGIYISSMFRYSSSLQSIPELNVANALVIGNYFFDGCSNLEFINLLNISKSLNVSYCEKLSRETIVNGILNNLVDLTGQEQQTLTLGSNLDKLTEEDKLIATNKNWLLN